ncbi:MAG: ABC transporter permease [Terriglobales bacterium]
MIKDLRFALRMLRRSPGFTILAVAVLALGIGANTAIFSLINAILLQPPPFAHPSQLVQMYETEQAPGAYPLSGPDFPDWQRQNKLFADMALYSYPHTENLTGEGAPQQVNMVPAEANFFQLLGVKPALGRLLDPSDGAHGASNVVVLNYAFWKSQFGGERSIIGKTIALNGNDETIIGVAPANFELRPDIQLWTPMDMTSGKLGERGNHSYSAIGRLKPGVTLAEAQAEISGIAARLVRQYPDSNADTGAKLFLLRDRLVRAPQRASLLTLLAVVGLVLLIACANLANMLLARALGRQKEISIRLALGARRAHILRQLLTESVLLALIGAALGAVLAWIGVRAVVGLSAFTLPQFNPIQVNLTVLAFTVGLAIVCGILFGLAPALQLSRPQLNEELSGAGALAGAGGRRRWLSDGLIVAEVALSMLLVVAAALFLQSFQRLRNSGLGMNPDHVVIAQINLPVRHYSSFPAIEQFQRTLLTRLRAGPGISDVATSSSTPLQGESNGYIELPGDSAQEKSLVEWVWITPGYLRTMQIPLLRGTRYTQADVSAWDRYAGPIFAPFVFGPSAASTPSSSTPTSLNVIVNQAMADHFYPGRDPLGQRFRQGTSGPWLVITGVVGNVAINQLGEAPMPAGYFPFDNISNSFYLDVRSSLPLGPLTASMRRVLDSMDSSLPLADVETMNQLADTSVAGQAFQEWLMSGFAALALLLAIAGIYGVMSYLVTARTREIGVRVALGASRASVLALVVGRGLRLALAGIIIGLLAALAAGRLIASQLYQVSPANPLLLAGAAAVLVAACLLACYVPARRAAGIDPARALRMN